jgi:serine/threonine-protein kinase
MPLPSDASDPGGWTAAATTTGPATGPAGDAMPLAPDDRFRDALAAALAPTLAVERELEGGGMARVFVAREVALGRQVVVKVLPPDLAAGVNRERFRREIQLSAALQHPHIVPLLAAGEVPAAAGAAGDPGPAAGSLYYTMPFIEGASLRAEVAARAARGAAFSPREVLRLLRDVVGALGYAHARGVVHRDVKPGNVLLQAGHALVTDFGVAKALAASLSVATHTVTTLGMAVGTPAYMAPEQLAADPAADHRVDLYAAALVAYELLTGASPFAAASPQATLAAQLTRVPEPLRAVRPDVSPALADVVMRCLAKDPAARPASAAELLDALDAADGAHAPGHAVAHAHASAPGAPLPGALAAGAALTADAATARIGAVTAPTTPTVAVAAPRRPGHRALAAVGAGAAVVLGAWVALGGARGRPAGTVAAAAAVGAAAPAPAPAPTPAASAPVLSRGDSVAIAKAIAREFARAMTHDAAAKSAGPKEPRPADRVDSARQRRAAREAVADSLTRAGAWQHVAPEMVRAVVGRLPMELPGMISVEERRAVSEELREARRQLRIAGRGHDGKGKVLVTVPPPPPPPGPPGAPPDAGGHSASVPWPGFASVTSRLGAPTPGVRRAVLVGTVDETGRPELTHLAPLLEAALRKRIGAEGPFELTNSGVAVLARDERVPDAVIFDRTGAAAVFRTKLRVAGDDEVRATLYVRGGRPGAPRVIQARVPFDPAKLPAKLAWLADSLAAPLARGAAGALGAMR